MTAVLAIAIVANGMLAGAFFVFACAVSPALGRLDDADFIHAYRTINRVIQGGWFLTVLILAPVSAVAAAVIGLGHPRPMVLISAAGCAVIVFAVTAAVNVPLNRALDEAAVESDPQRRAARQRFEAPWNRGNIARTVAGAASLAGLALAAVGAAP